MTDKPAPETPAPTEPGHSPGYIPRPPTPSEVDRISGQQGLISDEWAPEPKPDQPKTEGNP